MKNQCPFCGKRYEADPKFCPACGKQLNASDPAPETILSADRQLLIPRPKNYGDTEEYDSSPRPDENGKKEPVPASGNTLSLLLSVIAIVLAVTAIVLVVIFAILPTSRGDATDAADASAPCAAVTATAAPTDPPIAGVYTASEIKGGGYGIDFALLQSSTIDMDSDYTGKVKALSIEIGDVTLEKGSDKAVFKGVQCTYTFNGKVLTFDYKGVTLVYKKEQ